MDQFIVIKKEDFNEFKKELIEAVTNAVEKNFTASNDEYLTSKEVAKLFKISLSNLQTLRENGTIPFYKLQGKLLYKKSEIEKALLK